MPIKKSDTRARAFIKKYGVKAAEVDALLAIVPDQFKLMVQEPVNELFDQEIYDAIMEDPKNQPRAVSRLVKKKVRSLEA